MSRRTEKNVGVIGLGIIGQRVAACLRQRGFHVFVWNRTPRPFPNFVGSPAEIAQLCDVVQIFVSDDEAMQEMVQQMKQTLKPHHVVLAHSTIAPSSMRAAAEVVHRRGAQFLDAPFTGSKLAAEKGELVYYVSGDEGAFRRARPVLEASSKDIIEIGEIGQATTIKLATNMITAATAQAAAEALALVGAAGIPAEKFAEAMRGNSSSSGTLAMKLPKMIEGDFEPHFSVKHMLKDVQIVARLARSHGLVFGATEAARDSLLWEVQQGRGGNDYSSLVHSYFPEGSPSPPPVEKVEAEEQATLAGLEEAAAEEASAEDPAAAPEEAQKSDEPELIADAEETQAETAQADVEEEVPEKEAEETAPDEAPPVINEPDSEPEPDPEAAQKSEPGGPVPQTDARRGFFGRLFGKGADD